eukprot:TRINITY_DN2321_c0_g3_i1.p1 TRINITY_DN2321_c0_g3~~TRINITY_DN2321_c0_g3_i1.p1  ORF type:complete len:235 (-),score=78.25 TRINITY_DN2321_c0_g3_i1:592-1296(-)
MDNDAAEFKKVTTKTYENQAKFFLNAFWPELSGSAEDVWKACNKMVELDSQKGKNGSDLDEFNAHRFLEQLGTTKRVVELRESLREIDLDFNKRMALIEFLLFHYKQTIKELLSRPQGESEELQKAMDALANLKYEMEELRKEEESTNKKMATLKKKSQDSSLGQVQRNAASNELEQLQKGDNIRVRKGKVQTATKKTEDALAKLKSTGVSPGATWWTERELTEAKKYLPKSKQ